MLGLILAFPEKQWDDCTVPVNDEPVLRLTEKRLLMSKRIDKILAVVREDKLKTYSLHVLNPVPVSARSKTGALLKAFPDEPFFLVEGSMPLVMPFLVDYLIGLYHRNEPEAVIPIWRDGTAEVTQAIYEPGPLKSAIEAALAEGYRGLGKVVEFLDYEPVSIEELSRRNPKVTLSFLRIRSRMNAEFAEKVLSEAQF
ncbi:molybdenum cofactor guanylyltransferase [Thermococcus sp.]|uniref:molybdenum cofactor guanylyltransferase n=1 Tax=Thermococcus sp. TaxID=35749 RepID=UPI0026257BFA|nr:molybdenum cofactor guanylyltransferase [Thermococcus sp.]